MYDKLNDHEWYKEITLYGYLDQTQFGQRNHIIADSLDPLRVQTLHRCRSLVGGCHRVLDYHGYGRSGSYYTELEARKWSSIDPGDRTAGMRPNRVDRMILVVIVFLPAWINVFCNFVCQYFLLFAIFISNSVIYCY